MAIEIVTKSRLFVTEVSDEMKKVTWPDFPQLRNATWVIILFVFIVSLIILLMDVSVRSIINFILGIFTK
jgi:preprotein translocase subunit SecE